MGRLSLQLPVFGEMGGGCMLPVAPLLRRNLLTRWLMIANSCFLDVRSHDFYSLEHPRRKVDMGRGVVCGG